MPSTIKKRTVYIAYIVTNFIYWALVACVPIVIWHSENSYYNIMSFYELKNNNESALVGSDFGFYFHFMYVYSAVLLWPLCMIKVFKLIVRLIGSRS